MRKPQRHVHRRLLVGDEGLENRRRKRAAAVEPKVKLGTIGRSILATEVVDEGDGVKRCYSFHATKGYRCLREY